MNKIYNNIKMLVLILVIIQHFKYKKCKMKNQTEEIKIILYNKWKKQQYVKKMQNNKKKMILWKKKNSEIYFINKIYKYINFILLYFIKILIF